MTQVTSLSTSFTNFARSGAALAEDVVAELGNILPGNLYVDNLHKMLESYMFWHQTNNEKGALDYLKPHVVISVTHKVALKIVEQAVKLANNNRLDNLGYSPKPFFPSLVTSVIQGIKAAAYSFLANRIYYFAKEFFQEPKKG